MLDQRVDAAPYSVADPTRQVRPSNAFESNSSTLLLGDRSTIGKSLLIKGEIPGSESSYIEGTVEGSVNLSDDRVTVGRNGRVSANIAAREIVVLGEVAKSEADELLQHVSHRSPPRSMSVRRACRSCRARAA